LATAAGATALTATTGAATPRNETLPVVPAARRLGTAAENEAVDAEPAADAAAEVGIEAAVFSANAMGVLSLRSRGMGRERW
jgi:hypothetical protein